MSLNALSDRHLKSQLAAMPTPMRAPLPAGPPAAPPPAPPPKNALSSALDALTAFIPTEVITLYVAVLAAVTGAQPKVVEPFTVYAFFVAITPVLLLLLFLSKWVQQQTPPATIPAVRLWPWWKMIASAIAFAVWAAALPGNPIVGGAGATIAGILALAVPMLLTVITPIIER